MYFKSNKKLWKLYTGFFLLSIIFTILQTVSILNSPRHKTGKYFSVPVILLESPKNFDFDLCQCLYCISFTYYYRCPALIDFSLLYTLAIPIYEGILTLFVLLNFGLATFMDPGYYPRGNFFQSCIFLSFYIKILLPYQF